MLEWMQFNHALTPGSIKFTIQSSHNFRGRTMPMQYPKTEAEWLALRHQYISSTESAALLGLGDYQTPYEIGLEKQAKEPPAPFESTGRVLWGKRIQDVIAKGISDDYGVKVRRVNGYAVHPTSRLGASFDYEIVGVLTENSGEVVKVADTTLQELYKELGAGVLEIKNVDSLIFRKRWITEDKEIEAPPQIEIQLQHQLEAIQTRQWGVIGVLAGGNDPHIIVRDREADFGERIRAVVDEFWLKLAKGELPPITLPADIEIIRQLYVSTAGGKIYLPADEVEAEEIALWCKEYKEAGELSRHYEEARKTAGARIIEKMQDCEHLVVSGYRIKASTIAESVVKAFTRKAHKKLTISPIVAKDEE